MANLTGIVRLLKEERNRVQEQLSRLNAAIVAFTGANTTRKRPKLSAHARARIAAAQRARAKVRAAKKTASAK